MDRRSFVRLSGAALGAAAAGVHARAGAGISESGRSLHLRMAGRQRRRHHRAFLCRENAPADEPHDRRRKQAGRGRQHRRRICLEGQARRLHHSGARRLQHRLEHASVQAAADSVGQRIPGFCDHQPPGVRADGRRQQAVQDPRGSDRGDEGEGRQGDLRRGRARRRRDRHSLQGQGRIEVRRSQLQVVGRHDERHARRQHRLRVHGADFRDRANEAGQAAHPGRQQRQAPGGQSRICRRLPNRAIPTSR